MTVIRPNSIAGISSIFALGDQVQFLKADGMPAGVSIAGTVTFDDVTNVDSIGIVTARAGVNVGNPEINATISPNGDANFLGSVGIGTALPTSNLEVHRGTITLNATTSSDTTKLRWNYQGTEYQYIERDNANGGLAFGDNTSEQMRIDSSGRLGVGVSSPYAKLEVHDGVTSTTLSDPITIFSGTSYTANGLYGIGFHYSADSSGTAPVFIGYEPTAGAGNTKGNLVFGTRDTTTAGDAPSKRMVIDSSGNLLVGTTSAALGTSGRGLIETNGTTTAINALKVNGTSTAYFGTSATGAELAAQTSIPLKFLTNNQERMTIDSSGNIGIGTALPGNKLSVSKAGAESFDINPGSVANNNIILHYNWSGANYVTAETRAAEHVFEIGTSEAMSIDSSGRLLVGTTSTSDASTQILQGYYPGGSAEEAILKLQRGTASPGTNATLGSIQFASSAGRRGAEIFSQRDGGTWTDGSSHPGLLTFATTADGASPPTPRMTIDSSGRLLVGTELAPTVGASANARAVIQGNSADSASSFVLSLQRGEAPAGITVDEYLGQIMFAASDGSPFAEIAAVADADVGIGDYPGRLVFSTTADGASSPTERMRIKSTGEVTIGNAATISGEALELYSTSSDSNLGTFYARNNNTDAAHCVAAFATGTNSTATSNALIKFGINNYASGSGSITANGAGQAAFGTFSDERLKENIADLPSQWNSIKSLRPVEFDYIEAQGGGRQIGFIAQEFETVYPDAVGTSPMFAGADETSEEERLTITGWSKTEARLVKALQEAIAKIETLEAKVAALEAE